MTISHHAVSNHLNYFSCLEDDLLELSRWIEFTEENEETYSIELARLLMTVAAEADVVAKELCRSLGRWLGDQCANRNHSARAWPASTFASIAEELVSSRVLKRMLNHAAGGDVTLGHYVGKSETQLRAGWQTVADFVEAAAALAQSPAQTLQVSALPSALARRRALQKVTVRAARQSAHG